MPSRDLNPSFEYTKSVSPLDATLPSLQAVTFDVGGTLIEPWPSVGHIYSEEAARWGCIGVCPQELNRRFALAWGALKNFRHSRSEWSALVDATFGDLVEERPSNTFFESLYDRFAKAEAWRVYSDVLPTLSALGGRGLRLGIISNWDERLRPLLNGLGLDKHFQMTIVSCEVAHSKPDATIFNEAAARLRIPSKSIMHVGDSLQMDFLGAQAAGFQALHLCRKDKSSTSTRIHSLQELCQRIKAR